MHNSKTSLIKALAVIAFAMTGSALQAQFVNGSFESGNLTGWTATGGYNYGATADASGKPLLSPTSYTSSNNYVSLVSSGWDAQLLAYGVYLPTVYSTLGNYSAMVNNAVNDYSVSVLSQKVLNYNATTIDFGWAAVLEYSHGITDSDLFQVTVIDNTTNTKLYDVSYNSADTNTSSLFHSAGDLFYTNWQLESINVTQGHDYSIYVMGVDCPYGGHYGYVYVDGFASTNQGNLPTSAVPEPSTYGLMGAAGLLGLGALRRRFGKK